jgi:preprotein translocase subunit SecY
MNKLKLVWKVKELRDKVLFVFAMLAIFRAAAAIPVPGVDHSQLQAFFESNQFFGLLNIFTGGSLESLSVMMLGVGPYITATIILQLLTMIFPKLKQIYYEEGEAGRQKFTQLGRVVTVPLAALNGFGFIRLLQSQGVVGQLDLLTMVTNIVVVTAGSIFLMWIGELISEKGIGNGVSLIIFAGIVASVPQAATRTISTYDPAQLPQLLAFVFISLIVVAAIVLIDEAQRKIPVVYAKRVRGNKMYGGVQTHLPVRVNSAGVIPIIFALSIVLFPGMIASFLQFSDIAWIASLTERMQGFISGTSWTYVLVYFSLVFGFTYFYTAIVFDPQEVAKNIQRSGGFIPGIRPGEPTGQYLGKVISRTTLIGATFLGLIAVLPTVMQQSLNLAALTIGGTGVLIAVSVVLETVRQIDAQLTMREYETT